ncbi:hypothetical protein D9756_006895 [Leucocoprinus leucothites]|uniref:Uncharacterized protein n=1 Tax=Leucocoprinus leucothites TaxID=201217 RepID=A0A8H5D7D2_9AGAR|nr:hypothetical protein D9756_006895 [Leucoagaricus leucothites]
MQDMPSLWANIVTDLTEDYPPAPLFRLIAERSDPALVDVDLWGAGDLHQSYPCVSPQTNPGISYTTLADSLEALCCHIQRCRRFKVFVTDSISAESFVKIPFSCADRLEEVELATQCGQEIDDEIFHALRGLTALRRLKLLGFGNSTTIQRAMPTLPWLQLLHLDLSYPISTEEVFWLLQSCTFAVTVRIKAKMQVGYNGPAICVPNMRALSLSACGRNVLRSLRRIEAPKLEVFHLETRREASIYETPTEIPADDQFVWPSILNKSLSLRVLLLNDPGSTYRDALHLLADNYVKVIPIVKLGIRGAETFHAKETPHLLLPDDNMLGWVDSSVALGYGRDNKYLLSDIGVQL